MNPQETLIYWIRERYKIYQKKSNGHPKPWSEDEVFQRTYFCNVHRENDRITRWIRGYYSPFVDDPMFEYNIILSRFLNWPDTLGRIGYLQNDFPGDRVRKVLEQIESEGKKIWGNAYVITTHGIKMPKARYLVENVLGGVYYGLGGLRKECRGKTCGAAAVALQGFEGIGSFLAGQVVADLKNTVGHPLQDSIDRNHFVVPGPGSLRGLGWFFKNDPNAGSVANFSGLFPAVRDYVNLNWPEEVPFVDNQDLQNCLCEYDKYMRVKTGSGRSKRGYNGHPW